MKKQMMLIAACLSAATLLAACGGSDDPPPTTALAPAQVTVPINSTVAGAMKDELFEFSSIPELGTTGTTTLAFTSTSTNPDFTIAAGGATATGDTAFGSCTFRIRSSTFPPGHALAPGTEIRIDPCSIDIILENMAANGETLPKRTIMKLASRLSREKTIAVSVLPDGKVQIKGVTVITVPVTPVSGAGS
jgi:hypothetical protein